MSDIVPIGSWYHIESGCDTKIPDVVTSLHCDTRDFNVIMQVTMYSKENNKDVYRLLHGGKVNECFLMSGNDIIPWLQKLEAMSGGNCEWRMLNFKGIDTRLGWLKYIRFYRYKDNQFVVCDSFGEPIKWQLCTEENLDKKFLNSH